MSDKIKFRIADITEYPGPRYVSQGRFSGEEVYLDYLKEVIDSNYNKEIEIYLDETAGYAASFIDEFIGNIVYDFGLEYFENYFKVISDEEPEWIDIIREVKNDWEKKRHNKIPRKPDIT